VKVKKSSFCHQADLGRIILVVVSEAENIFIRINTSKNNAVDVFKSSKPWP